MKTVSTFLWRKTTKIIDRYKCLELQLTEHLKYAKHFAKPASYAFGLVITKYKSSGGLAFQTFTKLYENMIIRIICYGTSVWCINSVQLKAARFFMGVSRYYPNTGVLEDIGWDAILFKQL